MKIRDMEDKENDRRRKREARPRFLRSYRARTSRGAARSPIAARHLRSAGGDAIGCGHFEGLQDVLERFLTSFYRALDVRFVAEEFIAAGENVVALGRIQGKTRKAAVPVDVPFAHVWTVREGYLQRLRAFTDTAVLAHALAE
jgi:hypothetical protein